MKRNYCIVALIFMIFFVISLLTNILGPIIPDIIKSFDLSLTLAAFLPFSFFVAYGVMSIPAGMLIEKYREKPVLLASFLISFIGAIMLALFPYFLVALISLFLIGIGMAMLQVAINPLLRVSGGEEHFAFNSVFAQLIFGGASFISPFIYSYLVTNIGRGQPGNFVIRFLSSVVPANLSWVSLYYVFALVTILMAIVIGFMRFPYVERKEDEKAGAWETHKQLFKNKTVLLFFIGIFAYVGTEQGTANWISQFLFTYHHFDPQSTGAQIVAWFWGMMTAGCFLGLFLLKIFDSRKILIWFVSAAIILLSVALFGPARAALYAFALMGFAASVMWSIVFSLALNSLDRHHGSFSGILCTAIIGGAIVPLIIGRAGDMFGLRTGMLFLYITLGYLLSIGIWAKPLISNETISSKKENSYVNENFGN
jgi:MFS transporter, FHS family, L-fucose permease